MCVDLLIDENVALFVYVFVYLCVDVFVEMLVCVFVLMWNLLFMEMWFCGNVVLLKCVFVEMWFRAIFTVNQKYADACSKTSAYSMAINYNQIVMSLVSLFHSSLIVMIMRWLWL